MKPDQTLPVHIPDNCPVMAERRQVAAHVAEMMASLPDTAPTGDTLRYLGRLTSNMVLDLMFPRGGSSRAFWDLSEAQLFALIAVLAPERA